MNNMLLAVPVLLPVVGGGSILFSERSLRGRLKDISLECLVGGMVLLNSLIVACILLIPGARIRIISPHFAFPTVPTPLGFSISPTFLGLLK